MISVIVSRPISSAVLTKAKGARMRNPYPVEKLSAARRILMLPHPNGEEESIISAFYECSLGLKKIDKDTLDDSQREWVVTLEKLMNTDGLEDHFGKGLFRVKAEALTESEKFELSHVVNELATSFDREFFEK
jgi:hypothetical protein